MSDMQEMIETPKAETFIRKFQEAEHYTYYLMRAELRGEDLDHRSAQEMLGVLNTNSARLTGIHETLRKDSA